MTQVGNTDQIMALVRAQLQRMAKRESAGAPGKAGPRLPETLTARQRVEALAAVKNLNDQEFARALVRALLIEELGEGVAATTGFQSVLDRTLTALASDSETGMAIKAMRDKMQVGQ